VVGHQAEQYLACVHRGIGELFINAAFTWRRRCRHEYLHRPPHSQLSDCLWLS